MKMTKIAAAVLAVSLVAGGYAAAQTFGEKGKAEIVEETIMGDASAAEGITAQFGSYLSSSSGGGYGLSWTNSYTYGGEQCVTFDSGQPAREGYAGDSDSDRVDINMYSSFEFNGIINLLQRSSSKPNKELKEILSEPFAANAEANMKKLSKQVPDRGTKSIDVCVRDFLDYYNISGWISGDISIDMDYVFLTEDTDSESALSNAKVWKAWQEFFKIPVLEDEYKNYNLGKDVDGSIQVTMDNGAPEGKDTFYFNAESVTAGDNVYFLFDAHSVNDHVVDTSQMPDGFGIYRMPIETGDGSSQVEHLETIYELDPEAHYTSISVSSDGKKFFVSYYYNNSGNGEEGTNVSGSTKSEKNGNAYFGEVIDIDSCMCDEKIMIFDDSEDMTFCDEGDYLLFYDYVSEIKVYHYSDGAYDLWADVDGVDSTMPGIRSLPYNAKFLFEDGRFTAISYEDKDDWNLDQDSVDALGGDYSGYWQCNSVIVNVFGTDGHEYCGRLYSNMQDFYDKDSYEEVGTKLLESQKLGETFTSTDEFRMYTMKADSLLGLTSE